MADNPTSQKVKHKMETSYRNLSIVICTYNNAQSLLRTLRQITRQEITKNHSIELVLVDNNSNDRTKKIFDIIQKFSPLPMRYFLEPRQGLSHARNTGVTHADGDYILFTDDDAEIPISWIRSYCDEIEAERPDCLYSKIDIIWDKPAPWWYTTKFRIHFAGLDYGDKSFFVRDQRWEFIGKNFCIKKDVIVNLGGFDPALGRNGSKLLAGEETMIFKKLLLRRSAIRYFPDAPVGHRLKCDEYTEDHIQKKLMDSLYSSYVMAKLTAKKTLFGRPLRFLSSNLIVLLVSFFGSIAYFCINDRKEFFYHKIHLKRSFSALRIWLEQKNDR